MIEMAMAHTQTAVKNAPLFSFAAMIEDAKSRFARRRIYRQTVNELSALSNRDLADLGLHRSMIRRLAKQASDEYAAQ